MRSSSTTPRRAAAADTLWRGRAPSSPRASVATRSRAAADQRDRDRASHPSAALPALPRKNQCPAASRVGGSAFGPRLQAAVVTLTARHRDLAPRSRELASGSFRRDALDRGGRRDLPARLGRIGRPALPVAGLGAGPGAVHVDETGWRTRGEGRALWTATTPEATFFQIAEHCNREQFNALIGTLPGDRRL